MKLSTIGKAPGHVLALCLLATPCWAAPLVWTGAASSPGWSAAANWNGGHPPVDGDGVVFDGAAGASTTVDLSVSLDTLTFAAGAGPFQSRVAGIGGRALSFGGQGIQNLTGGSGPIRQSLFADAGSSGGSIVFTGTSGVNLGLGSSYRPVDLTAMGGSVIGQIGGRIVFQDRSSTGLNTFNGLRAEGATAAGAGAAELLLRDQAIATRFTTLTLTGGAVAGAAGGQGSFLDSTRVDGIVNVSSGSAAGGSGGRALFAGNAVAGVTSTLNNQGGRTGTGSEGVTEFRTTSRFSGTAINAAGTVAGASGGRLEFRDQAAFDSTGYDGSLGSLQIINRGGSVSGAGGGSTVFRDASGSQGSFLVIVNGADSEGTASGTLGGRTRFTDQSRAGQLTIYNDSGRSAAGAGQTSFENGSSADHARIENRGGQLAGAVGGQTLFSHSATAGSATLVNAAGEVAGASGGVTRFTGNAVAGNAHISNRTSLDTGGGGRGSTSFGDSSSAQNATIDNQGGLFPINAFTTFSQSATAGNATITNFGGLAAGAGGGRTQFLDTATAGAARLVMTAGGISGAGGGQVYFFANAGAGSAALDLRGAGVIGAEGGRAFFQNDTSAGSSHLTLEGSKVGNPGGPEGAIVTFNGRASASSATFVVGGNTAPFGGTGRVRFDDAATAANATIKTLAGYDSGGRLSFQGSTVNTASAGYAHITNGSRATASGSSGDFGGSTSFLAHSSADHAVIVNEAGRTAFGAQTVFRGDATAASASITSAGGQVGELGGITFFVEQSTAGQSTLIAGGGSDSGSAGRIVFQDQASGGSARVVLQAGSGVGAGGRLDIGGADVWVAVGSIEGGGLVNLGARTLIVTGPAATTFSGVISGSAPPVFPSLAVMSTLTLTGANTYAGRTSIGDGVNAGSGKLVVANATGSATGSGEVRILNGGTLAGSGFIAGPVKLFDGGTIAPGDPVTLTLQDSFEWNGGGLVRLVLGADSAGSDHLRVGTLIRGTDGPFVFDLVDFGITAGAEYDLLSFDSMTGFAASDFQSTGFAGTFAFHQGLLSFTASGAVPAVPEPSTYALLLLGLVLIRGARKLQR